jgi:hypothetical protein
LIIDFWLLCIVEDVKVLKDLNRSCGFYLEESITLSTVIQEFYLKKLSLLMQRGVDFISVLGQKINVKDKVRELALTVDHHNLTYSKDRTY